jgi:hypothetical protein
MKKKRTPSAREAARKNLALVLLSDAAFVALRFKEKRGPMKRRFPTPYRASRLERAGRFINWRSTNV